jgi:hypothetical protein
MDSVPKNKRYIIQRITEVDPSLSVDELKGKTILELTKIKEDQKIKLTEKIDDDDEEMEYKSPMDYCVIS